MTPRPESVEQFHRVSLGLTSRPWVFFAGGVGMLAVSAVGFFVALYGRTGPLQLHLSSTLPAIFAVGLFMTGFRFAASPREVALTQEGLEVRFASVQKRWVWEEIAWAEVQTQAITNRQMLAIHGNDGKVLAKLPSNLERFDALVDAVKGRLSEHPSPHAAAVRWRKSRKQAKWMVIATAVALAGAVFMAWMTIDQRRTEMLLRQQGIDGQGIVVRKFIAPDGRTHRIEYRVAGAGEGAKLHNVEIDLGMWALIEAGSRVAVTTVPGRPDVARLNGGEIKDDFETSPVLNILLCVGMLVLTVFFLVAAIFGFKGIDITTDKVTGKLKIERLPR